MVEITSKDFCGGFLCFKSDVFLHPLYMGPKKYEPRLKHNPCSQFFIAAFPGFIAQFLGLYDFHVFKLDERA